MKVKLRLQERLFGSIYHRINTFRKLGMSNAEIIGVLYTLLKHFTENCHLDKQFLDVFIKSEIICGKSRK